MLFELQIRAPLLPLLELAPAPRVQALSLGNSVARSFSIAKAAPVVAHPRSLPGHRARPWERQLIVAAPILAQETKMIIS